MVNAIAALVCIFTLLHSIDAAADERVPIRSIATSTHQEIDTGDALLTFKATLRPGQDAFGGCHFIASFKVAINQVDLPIPVALLQSIRSPRLEAATIYTVVGDVSRSLFIDVPFGDSYPIVGPNAYRDRSILRLEINTETQQALRISVFDFKSSGHHVERNIWERTQ